MLNLKFLNYELKKDIDFVIEAEKSDVEKLSKDTKISKTTLNEIKRTNVTVNEVYEKFYSYVYDLGYRLNLVKEEFLKETNKLILYHGSKFGLEIVDSKGSKSNCDFGNGFYLGESYSSTLSFVCENKESSIYSFELDLNDLKIVKFSCSLEWMLAICYYKGYLKKYKEHNIIKKITEKVENTDLIIAPIADNRMFYIMSLFANADITDNVAIHSLSASSFGNQYVIKTEKALNQLSSIEKYYVCQKEKEHYIELLNQRTNMIETKLKLSKREFRDGLYIEEILG